MFIIINILPTGPASPWRAGETSGVITGRPTALTRLVDDGHALAQYSKDRHTPATAQIWSYFAHRNHLPTSSPAHSDTTHHHGDKHHPDP